MAKQDKSKDDEVLTTQNDYVADETPPDGSEEPTDQEPSADAPETGPVPTIESAEGDEPGDEPDEPAEPGHWKCTTCGAEDTVECCDDPQREWIPDEPDEPDEPYGPGGGPNDPDEEPDEEPGDAPETDGAVSAEVDLSSAADVAGPHAAPDANEDDKAEAVAASRPRPDDDSISYRQREAQREASEFLLDVPVIRELKSAFKFLAAQLASQSEFEEIKRNFPNIFK